MPATSEADFAAWGRLYAPDAIRLDIDLEAKPTPRPRVTKSGIAFMPKDYTVYLGELQREMARLHNGPALVGPLVVRVEVAKARPKSTTMFAPRGDVDNLAKGVLDAATKTGLFWKDDVQIARLFATKRWGPKDVIEFTLNTLEAPA